MQRKAVAYVPWSSINGNKTAIILRLKITITIIQVIVVINNNGSGMCTRTKHKASDQDCVRSSEAPTAFSVNPIHARRQESQLLSMSLLAMIVRKQRRFSWQVPLLVIAAFVFVWRLSKQSFSDIEDVSLQRSIRVERHVSLKENRSNPVHNHFAGEAARVENRSILFYTALIVVTSTLGNLKLDSQINTWLALLPNVLVFETGGPLIGSSFIEAFSNLTGRFGSEMEWFILVDDDTYIDVNMLERLLSQSLSKDALYMGLHHCQGPNFECRNGSVKDSLNGWINGGAGIILNRALAMQIDWTDSSRYYSKNWPYHPPAADVAVACTIQDLFLHEPSAESRFEMVHVPNMHYHPKKLSECECVLQNNSFCTDSALPAISLHHLKHVDMERVYLSQAENQIEIVSYCQAGSSSDAFNFGDCLAAKVFMERYNSSCLQWYVSGPWAIVGDTSSCARDLSYTTGCVDRNTSHAQVRHCGQSLKWLQLNQLPPWVLADDERRRKYLEIAAYREEFRPRTLLIDRGLGIRQWLNLNHYDLFHSDSKLVGVRHEKCAVVLRGPHMCDKNFATAIDSYETFDAVFRKANEDTSLGHLGKSTCSGNRTTYGVTHTLDPKQVGGALRRSENIIFIPNDDPEIFQRSPLLYEGRQVSIFSRSFSMFLRNATCPCSLVPGSEVVPGISSGFYIVFAALHMCSKTKVFCWENFGWGTPSFFDKKALVYNDRSSKTNHFADLKVSPKNQHCLFEEALWLRELRDEGLIEYSCGDDESLLV